MMPGGAASLGDRLLAWLLYPLPHHLLSRLVFRLSRWQTPLCQPFLRFFVRRFGLAMEEAEEPRVAAYRSFNELFTRALRAGARPLVDQPDTLVCPVDGRVSQLGEVNDGTLVQAKGRSYRMLDLLGGSPETTVPFATGSFATLYLSPRDYHRIHMPCDGELRQMIHVPGRLFSVAPHTVRAVPRLFARNERVVCLFLTPHGPLAMILVGAINVAAIETVWAGLVTPPRGRRVQSRFYRQGEVALRRGEEMGRFNLGSTVIVVCGERISWSPGLATGQPVRLGSGLGTVPGGHRDGQPPADGELAPPSG